MKYVLFIEKKEFLRRMWRGLCMKLPVRMWNICCGMPRRWTIFSPHVASSASFLLSFFDVYMLGCLSGCRKKEIFQPGRCAWKKANRTLGVGEEEA